MTGSTNAEAAIGAALHPVSLRWVMKRAALGILLLTVLTGTMAWLTYESGASDRNAALSGQAH